MFSGSWSSRGIQTTSLTNKSSSAYSTVPWTVTTERLCLISIVTITSLMNKEDRQVSGRGRRSNH
jgi:hypothetical protein